MKPPKPSLAVCQKKLNVQNVRSNCLVERSEMLTIRSSVSSLLKETVFVEWDSLHTCENRLIIKSYFEKFFSPTHEITYIAGYLLSTDAEYSVHHDHIWAVLQCFE